MTMKDQVHATPTPHSGPAHRPFVPEAKVAVISIIGYSECLRSTGRVASAIMTVVRVSQGRSGMMKHSGSCHCGAIRVELRSERQPQEQVIGACQCSFCRKHNARTFSDPNAFVTLTAHEPEHLRRYEFGLKTSEQIICGRCGVYVAMTIIDAERVLSVINIDVLDDRASFDREPQPRDYSAEDRAERIQ